MPLEQLRAETVLRYVLRNGDSLSVQSSPHDLRDLAVDASLVVATLLTRCW